MQTEVGLTSLGRKRRTGPPEQIPRKAREWQEAKIRSPKITDDPTAQADYRLRKRKEFETLISRASRNKSVWVKYAEWEESQKDLKRARSIWERALAVDALHHDHTIWLKYIDMEMKNKFVNHARNVWDRAVTLLPRVDQLWYKYIHMEEMLGNVAGARYIFWRWMTWMPDQHGWLSYIKFELRYNEIDKARAIFKRFVQCHPKVSAWIRFAKFEMENGEIERARNCYERAVEKLADDEEAKQLLVVFPEFEDKFKKTDTPRKYEKKKVILKLEYFDEKIKQKAIMINVASLEGVESISIDSKEKKLTITGNIDPVSLVFKLRKLCSTDILSVGPAKEPEKKKDGGSQKDERGKKEEGKKDDAKKGGRDKKKKDGKDEAQAYPAPMFYHYQQPYQPTVTVPAYYNYPSIEEDPNSCVIF
ncbi:hypothetical protein KY284_017337 [Solanum tuberosum]|nr:hypothetical protein KY284_017337 [Solanum tuberosum]